MLALWNSKDRQFVCSEPKHVLSVFWGLYEGFDSAPSICYIFLANFHQLKFDSNGFFPYKSVPKTVTLYNGTVVDRPNSFMYVFMLLKIQYRMNQTIATFINKNFYNNILKNGPKIK